MKLPYLHELETSRDMIQEFRGYNHNLRIDPGEFYNMTNLTSSLYPVLTPRAKRAKVRSLTKPNGLHASERLCWVDGTEFWYGGRKIEGMVLEDSEKTIVSMGAYVVIFPDAVYYNSKEDSFGTLANIVTTTGAVTAALCKVDGEEYGEYPLSDTAPAEPKDGDLWLNTSEIPHVLMQYSETYSMWSSVPTTYVKISATGIGQGFAEYDGVTIEGMEDASLNGSFVLYGAKDDYIIITAVIDKAVEQTAAVTVSRSVPKMDFVTESENRIWGCSSEKHEIYACKLGDPKNWNCFMGISTDSYAMTVGSAGEFTGACTHLGYVLFFKENVIHKIYGNKPANYQLTNTNCRGVEKGSHKSLVIVNETLYYKSRYDICAVGSALPTGISDALGQDARYKNAVGGACGPKYYVCMEDETGTHDLFVYDEKRGMWHREDDVDVAFFVSFANDLYFIDRRDNCLYSVCGKTNMYADETAEVEKAVKWNAESGDFGLDHPDRKYISKLQIRMEVFPGSDVKIELQYDSSGRWETVYRQNYSRKRSFTLPIIPKRCDHMRYRISGTGYAHVYSITKTIEQGTEL